MQAKYDAKSKTVTITFAYDAKMVYPLSKSGKNQLPATSNGFTLRCDGTPLVISLNTMQPKETNQPA